MSREMASRPGVALRDMPISGVSSSDQSSQPQNTGPQRNSPDRLPGAWLAHVRVAIALTEDERNALARALERHFGHAIRLNVQIDSRILGGVWVQMGDTIIDGSLQGRLEALRHHLRTSSRTITLGAERVGTPEDGRP